MNKKNLILGGIIAALVLGNVYFYGLASDGLAVWNENEMKYTESEEKVKEANDGLERLSKEIEILKERDAVRDEIIELMISHEETQSQYCEGTIDKTAYDFERKMFFAKSETFVKRIFNLESELENLK